MRDDHPLRRAFAPDGRLDLRNLDRDTLAAWLTGEGEPLHRAHKVFQWAWGRGVDDFHAMANIPKETRRRLDAGCVLSRLESAGVFASEDGTTKFLWKLHDGHHIESVLIPDTEREGPPRLTLCISTQVGCAMACSFCLTGDLGLKRNLTPAEIANQPRQVQAALGAERRITNIVMMGMGEPLHNYDNVVTALRLLLEGDGLNFSHRKVTVSTVGLVPRLKQLAETLPVNIAVSLNASTEEQRRQVMPITAKYSMAELMDACRTLPLPAGKRITFEYVMMDGFNASLDDAARVEALMRDVPSKVNLIPYNENPDRTIRRPSDADVKAFQHYLVTRGIQCSIRHTRGRDISAACGQLGKAAEIMARRLVSSAGTPAPPAAS
jgi:23S rRNA (adenine2503-C2)-methyltransferase